MNKYFAYNYKNNPFHLFSKEHLITLLIIGFLGICIFIFSKKLRKHRRFIRFGLAILLLATEVCLQSWYVYFHAWSARTALPLELSDLTVLLSIVMLLSKNTSLFKFIYFAGIGSSIQAMLTPDLGKYSFPHFRYIEFFVSHGGVFLASLFMIAVYKYRPTFRSLWVTVLIVNIYGVCIFIIDRLIHANYLFIIKKPKTPSLLNVLGPWPWYILSLEAVMIIIFLVLNSPFWIQRKKEGA